MTNETAIVDESPIAPPMVPPSTPAKADPENDANIDAMIKRLEALKGSKDAWVTNALEAFEKKIETQLEKDEKAATERALGEKREAFVDAVRTNVVDVLGALGIVIPAKGMLWEMKIEGSATGPMVSMTLPEKKTRASSGTSSGTRTASGTGTASVLSMTNPAGSKVKAFKLPDGSETTKAVDVANVLGCFVEKENQGRTVLRFAKGNVDKANEIIVSFDDGTEAFLGDAVAVAFPAKAVATPAAA